MGLASARSEAEAGPSPRQPSAWTAPTCSAPNGLRHSGSDRRVHLLHNDGVGLLAGPELDAITIAGRHLVRSDRRQPAIGDANTVMAWGEVDALRVLEQSIGFAGEQQAARRQGDAALSDVIPNVEVCWRRLIENLDRDRHVAEARGADRDNPVGDGKHAGGLRLACAQRKRVLGDSLGQEVELIAVGVELEVIAARMHHASLQQMARAVKRAQDTIDFLSLDITVRR